MPTYKDTVDRLEWFRRIYGIPNTPELINNSRSHFHKENYLKELDRLEQQAQEMLKGIRMMKKTVRRIA